MKPGDCVNIPAEVKHWHGAAPVSYTHLVSIREDDGYSGATFDRPAFKLMMQDVKEGLLQRYSL